MMQLVQRVRELSWLSDELEREVECLGTTQYPVIHRFLALSLADGMARRAATLGQLVEQGSSVEVPEEKAS